MKKCKRILSMLLTLIMVFSIIPMGMIESSAASEKIFPVAANRNAYGISSSYGPRTGGYHLGVDISSGGKALDIVAYSSGTVIRVEDNCNCNKGMIKCDHYNFYGNMVVIRNVDGTYAYYGHLRYGSIVVKKNQEVVAGQKLGLMGSSGYSSGVHLHFELRTTTDSSKRNKNTCLNVNEDAINYKYITKPIDDGYEPKQYSVGTYTCDATIGVNMRTGAGTQYSKVALVPYNADIYVTEINGDWGKCTYNGKTGWTCLDYYNFKSVAVPQVPSLNISTTAVAAGSAVTLNWNSVSHANRYELKIIAPGGQTSVENMGTNTSWTKTLDAEGVYTFSVSAYNIENKSNGFSGTKNCTAYAPSTVKFVDWDNTELKTVTVKYGENAVAPESPSRKGYSFQGWDGSYYNVTSDRTIKALYKINTYTVRFLDKSGDIMGSAQKVNYNESAVEPEDKNIPVGYEFLGWDSDTWKNAYTDDSSKTIDIHGIYAWKNYDLPIVCTNLSAQREADGYYVYFDLTNYDKEVTRGRAVVSLKTASGKLVDMTESTAFSIAKNDTKSNIEVFIPCDEIATKAEVIIVSSYSSGVPLSESVESSIIGATDWTLWSPIQPENPNGTLDVESKIQYRYRDKEFSTGNTKTKDGWMYVGVHSTTQSGGTSWSAVSAFNTESQKRDVWTTQEITGYNTKTQYRYSHYTNGSSSVPAAKSGYTLHFTDWSDNPKGVRNELKYNGTSYARYHDSSSYWGWCNSCGRSYFPWYNQETRQVNTSAIYGTLYHFTDTFYTYNFYRWKDWSAWSDEDIAANDNREVETQTLYRYKSNNISTENEDGKIRTFEGKLDSSLAGKQITMFVYGYTGASDYTNQYIGQSVIGDDGSYSFDVKLRQEPTMETGDYAVAIGVEGTTNTIVIDTIKAPVPKYTVNFYDFFGNIISTQEISEGRNAVVPVVEEIEGYEFIGWDKSNINIRENTDIFADYERKEYSIIFIDWTNQFVEVKTFKHGDVITTPDFAEIEGYNFVGWDELITGNVLAKKDMVITALYEKEICTVNFYDTDGNVIDSQEIAYGESAIIPDDPSKDGIIFTGWFNPEEYQNVDSDVNIYPSYVFEKTAETPVVNYETGEYTESLSLTLSSSDEDAVIFYYMNGDESTEAIYTGPISVNKTCSVTFYAECLGKNTSAIITNYYCINSDGTFSNWMKYDEIPESVKTNIDDYIIENKNGYRFKDTMSTYSVNERDNLLNTGWDLSGEKELLFTDWQDAVLTDDSSIVGYVVETRKVDDITKTNYKYSHYKYTDAENNVCYSPVAVDGFDCEYEEIICETRLTIAGFLEDNTSFYEYDSQRWFKQTKISGTKTQYRAKYESVELFKWTSWDITAPEVGDVREFETSELYRYANKNYHLVYINTNIGDLPFVLMTQENTALDINALEVYGYYIEGLYLDNDFTQPFLADTPVSSSLTLYANYEPKTFTVVFQMQDGTEIDTQQVIYMDTAVAPATDAVPGYVFAGWDKDYDMITEDTIITGKYFKESEYARVSLDKTKTKMYAGNKVSLTATITPANLSDETVEWTTSDSSVAIVDDKGNVTAVGAGTAEITVTVLKTKEKATCIVTVNVDSSMNIIINHTSSLNYDSLGYLRRIGVETTVGNAKKNFENDNLVFTNMQGKLLDDSGFVGTGTVISVKSGDKVLDSKTCIVTGDMNGDGKINNRDVSMLCRYLVDKETPAECQILAMDANGDGKVNNKDAALLSRYLVGKATL